MNYKKTSHKYSIILNKIPYLPPASLKFIEPPSRPQKTKNPTKETKDKAKNSMLLWKFNILNYECKLFVTLWSLIFACESLIDSFNTKAFPKLISNINYPIGRKACSRNLISITKSRMLKKQEKISLIRTWFIFLGIINPFVLSE